MSQRDPPPAYCLWLAMVSVAVAMLTLALMRSSPNERFAQHARAAVTPTLPD
jgi:hypothetical protein